MPRDFDPSVRDREAAATRRGTRRDPESVDRRPDPERREEPAAESFAPTPSRLMRDEHRPRRGTLPDRRMLRRDTPIDYSAEFAEPEVPAEPRLEPQTEAPRPHHTDGAGRPDGGERMGEHAPRPDAVTVGGGDGIEHDNGAERANPGVGEGDSVRGRADERADLTTWEAAGLAEPTGPVRGEPVVDESPSRPVKRRLPALPPLEPSSAATEPGGAERGIEPSQPIPTPEMSGSLEVSTGRELAVHEADSGDALRATASGVLSEPGARGGAAGRRGAQDRARGPERGEGDRLERRRIRENAAEDPVERRGGPAERRGGPAERRRERPRAEGETGRPRRSESEREAPRGNGSEGRARPTDPDRVHLGGRAGSPGRARPARPEGEVGERAMRGKPTRGTRPERGAAAERVRGSGRKPKRDKEAEKAERAAAAKRAAARKAAAKKKQQGPKLLDDSTRAKLEVTAREGSGIKAAWATFRLHTDDLRRRNFAARAERMEYGSFDEFDRTTAQLTDRGYIGPGGGRMNVVGRPVEYRATTAQVAGLWPWSVGAGAPLIGTPLGSHLHTGAPVCFDPMNWFMRGSFITAPSLFVLGLNGFGKSSLVRRIVLGGVAQGITPLVLADVKPDYRKLVEMVGGQVIDLGYGYGKLNPLAAGVLGSIVPMLGELPELQTQVMQEMRARQVTLIAGLVELVRGARVRDFEETLIATGLRILYREGSGFTPDQPPIIEDLLEVIVAGGDELQLDAGADNPDEYHEAIKGLRRSLRALTQGPFGAVFNGHTTTPIDTNSTAVCIDVSHIPTGDKKLKAAVMLACWADGFASVEAAHVLADAGMGPQRYFQVVMDELWQVLGLGDFMVDRVDELTRLQRGIATSLIMISHTIKDLQALGSEAAIAKALGFLERARAKIFGALPAEEIARLDSTVPFTSAEEEMVTSWSAPQALTGEALKPGQTRPPAPGTGKFLLKIGEDRRPGIPFHMEFTLSERESGIHDTNQRFSEFTETTASRGSDEGSAA
ncbi:hypothetical protein VMT65_10720 [Nocardia sp. CDC153]|uniref:hypothetical protein n=1 Tax=Nocardia sp. CDC153 TaxID=3112167 RepID=UPI002DC04544|nr:hypothetical protein [Nocardia sp. CDC153]MEC3953504.1 hypothetical protein [Nocardia sp. CDC153]